MTKIIFYSSKPYVISMFEKEKDNYNCEFCFKKEPISLETASWARGFDVACVFVNDSVSREVLNQLKENGVKLLALRCAGFNNVDLKAAEELGIPVVRVPEYSPYAVAEFAMGMLLSLNRKIYKAYDRVKGMNFSIDGLLGFDLHEKTMGVIGTGKIGQLFIKICKGFGLKVLAYDPILHEEKAKELGFTYTSLDEIYSQSDVIALHCPLTKDNHHLINKNSIAKMKKGVYIINTSRGGLYKAEDVIEALKKEQIGGFAADVYEKESGLFFEDCSEGSGISDDILARLISFPNVLITAHQGFFTQEALSNIAKVTLDNSQIYFEKGQTPNIVKA